MPDLTVFEGYFDITATDSTTDCDHGPCTAYDVPELGMIFYLYADKPNLISFHELEGHHLEDDPVRDYLDEMARRGDGQAASLLKTYSASSAISD